MIYKNELINIQIEESEVPWFKIFSNKPYKEFTDLDKETKYEVIRVWEVIERELIKFYNPDKINVASFGNYLPHFHLHVMARFKNDSYFPEPMWGKKQREGSLNLPPIEEFIKVLIQVLERE